MGRRVLGVATAEVLVVRKSTVIKVVKSRRIAQEWTWFILEESRHCQSSAECGHNETICLVCRPYY